MSEKIVSIGSEQFELTVEHEGSRWRAADQEIELLSVGDGEALIRIGKRELVVPFHVKGSSVSFSIDGEIIQADVAQRGGTARPRHRDHSTSAPMPGVVLKILVKPGDRVTRGTPVLILEAMKMEHQIAAPADGVVLRVNCTEGELVQPGVELVEVEESTEPEQ